MAVVAPPYILAALAGSSVIPLISEAVSLFFNFPDLKKYFSSLDSKIPEDVKTREISLKDPTSGKEVQLQAENAVNSLSTGDGLLIASGTAGLLLLSLPGQRTF